MFVEYFLPDEEMIQVLECDRKDYLAIGGVVDFTIEGVILYTGSLEVFFVSFDEIEPSAAGVAPNFTAFKVIDHGNTLQFGKYEAAFDSLLYILENSRDE